MSVQKDRSLNRLTTLNVRYLAQKLRGNRNLGNDHHPFLCLPTDRFQINYRVQTKKKVYFGKRLPKGYRIDENGVKFVVCQRIVSGQTGLTKRLAVKLGAKLKFLSNC